VDIVVIKDGILIEHWDVIQDEATKDQSTSGHPMFGRSFPVYARVAIQCRWADDMKCEGRWMWASF